MRVKPFFSLFFLLFLGITLPLMIFISQQQQTTQQHGYNHLKRWSGVKNHENHAQFTWPPPLNVVVPQHAAGGTTVTIDLNTPDVVTQFMPGITHTENDLGSNTTAGQQLLKSGITMQNVSIMGWGTDNIESSPGSYDWSSLDPRIQLMRDTGATMMVSLCCAPDWMKGGTAGQTDWSKLEVAPLPSHYADFAELSKQVALRYKDVKYFSVWNELKGFWLDTQNHWDYQGYTQMYNLVYNAIKSVRPDAQIGGPYPSIISPALYSNVTPAINDIRQAELDVISYWLKNKTGADFIALDGGPGPIDTTVNCGVANAFNAGQYFQDIVSWIRQQPGGSNLPIGWTEWYPCVRESTTDLIHANASDTSDLIFVIKSGAFYALPWGDGEETGPTQIDGIMDASGKPTPFYSSLKALKDNFPPGTQLYKTTVNPSTVTVMASRAKTMLVNQLGGAQTVNVNNTVINLAPYQVLVINTPGGGSVTGK